jgi:hypothetical protein
MNVIVYEYLYMNICICIVKVVEVVSSNPSKHHHVVMFTWINLGIKKLPHTNEVEQL